MSENQITESERSEMEIDSLKSQLAAAIERAERATDTLHIVMDQLEKDLKGAHADIVKLQGGDPAKYTWPEWSPQANSLRWFERLREEFPRAALKEQGGE